MPASSAREDRSRSPTVRLPETEPGAANPQAQTTRREAEIWRLLLQVHESLFLIREAASSAKNSLDQIEGLSPNLGRGIARARGLPPPHGVSEPIALRDRQANPVVFLN
jgi:hypothetical protein